MMKRRITSVILIISLSIISVVSLFMPDTSKAMSSITGKVFRDFNDNGVMDVHEPGIANVTVTAYDAVGVVQGSTTTDVNGDYTLDADGSGPYRIEFSGWPSYLQPSAHGSHNATSVQFVPDGSSTANFALLNPKDYSQPNPMVAISRMRSGRGGPAGEGNNSYPGVLAFNYYNTGMITETNYIMPATSVFIPSVGSVWGNAYQRESKHLYVSSFLRRHAGFAHGPSYIYLLDYSNGPSNTPIVKLSLQGITPSNGGPAIDLGSVCRNDARGGPGNLGCVANGTGRVADYQLPVDASDPSVDLDAFGKVGMISYGGIDLSEDESTLWLVNLNQRALISVDVSNVDNSSDTSFANSIGDVNQYLLDDLSGVPSCTDGVFRPWAITFHDGYGYLGGICTAENETVTTTTTFDPSKPESTRTYRVNDDVSAHVLRFDPANIIAGFTSVVNFGLNYNREAFSTANTVSMWLPWTNDWADFVNLSIPPYDETHFYSHVQAMFGNIEFADDGAMIIGLIDRSSYQLGHRQYGAFPKADIPIPPATTPRLYHSVSAGDIIRVCAVGNDWVVEGTDPSCPVNEPIDPNVPLQRIDDGPSNKGEFFYHDRIRVHQETALGALAHLAGSGEIMAVVLDPHQYGSAGTRRFSTIDGTNQASYELYLEAWNDYGAFYKSSALGDIELLSDPAPIEVGNRVWIDTNRNGIQDPDEPPVAGVTVRLYAPDGVTLLATAITDSDGTYYFSNGPGTDRVNAIYNIAGLTTNTDGFQIRLDNLADYEAGGPLEGYRLTTPDQQTGDDDVSGDISDSDGTLADPTAPIGIGNFPTKVFSTGPAGYNNHTYDFGFWPTYSLGNRVWFDLNNNGLIDADELGVDGVVVDLYLDSDGDGVPDSSTPLATTVTADGGYYRFDNLPAGNYVVEINPSNFSGNRPLVGYLSSTPTEANPNSDVDSNDNGIDNPDPAANGIRSGVVTLGPNASEPTGESDLSPTGQGNPDDRSNMTVDFGFFLPASLGDYVWHDVNEDGIQDPNEPGVPGVTVTLYDEWGNVVATTTTDSTGKYLFDGLKPGTYSVGFSNLPPELNQFTKSNQGSDDGLDSDADPTTGRTQPITLAPGEHNPTLDAGIHAPKPTPIQLSFFSVQKTSDGMLLQWSTSTEIDTWGFHILRSDRNGQNMTRLTNQMILAKGGRLSGADYSWLNSTASEQSRYSYWLEVYDIDGSITRYGPVTLQPNSAASYHVFLPNVIR